MSREAVEVVQRIFDAVGRDDRRAILSLYDPDVEWDTSRGSLGELLGGTIYRGHEGLRTLFRHLQEPWEDYEDRLEEVIDVGGENVVTVVTTSGRGRASGVEVEQRQAAVWTIRDRKVARVIWFSTRDEALEAASQQTESQGNVEVVKAIFEAWKERDRETALKRFDPDVEIDMSTLSLVGERIVDRGVDGLQRTVASWLEAWDALEFLPESFIAAGDEVIVWLRMVGQGRTSEVPAKQSFASVYTLRKGVVVRWRGFDTLAATAAAVGI
jgi:ketosteroid isomerase-like protein